MDALIHQLMAGLATCGIYASLALALVMIYQATHLVNFAQGEMAMFSTYIAWSLVNAGVPYWLAFALTVGISFLIGILVERIVIRPVENAPVLAVVTVIGTALSGLGLWWADPVAALVVAAGALGVAVILARE